MTRIKVPAWWLLHDTTHAFLSPLFFIKGSCFQNVPGLSLSKVNFLSLRKKYSGAFIILSEVLHESHYHFTWCNLLVSNQTSVGHFSLIKYSGAFIILSEVSYASHYHFTWCNLFVSNQTSVGHFSLIYFFINLTFVMCNRPQASCSCI